MREIMISESDFETLTEVIKTFRIVDPELIKCKDQLNGKLKSAIVQKDEDIPKSLVQLNSIVTVCTSFGRKVGLELVLPMEADFHERKLSILSPLGTALFGIKQGKRTLWHFPNGDEWITIEKVDNSLLELVNESN